MPIVLYKKHFVLFDSTTFIWQLELAVTVHLLFIIAINDCLYRDNTVAWINAS